MRLLPAGTEQARRHAEVPDEGGGEMSRVAETELGCNLVDMQWRRLQQHLRVPHPHLGGAGDA